MFKLQLPPLRERKEDIPDLITYFLNTASKELNTELKTIDDKTIEFLKNYMWPGNIRQLKNLIERVLILGDPSEKISNTELILSEAKSQDFGEKISLISTKLANMSLREAREIFERDYLILQINRFGGNISKTAAFVEMERSALHRKLKSLGINSGQKN